LGHDNAEEVKSQGLSGIWLVEEANGGDLGNFRVSKLAKFQLKCLMKYKHAKRMMHRRAN
jgi:hypothetical protein